MSNSFQPWIWVILISILMIVVGVLLMGIPGAILLSITAPLVGLNLDDLGFSGFFGSAYIAAICWPMCIPIAFGISRMVPLDQDGTQGRRVLVIIAVLFVTSIVPALFLKALALTY